MKYHSPLRRRARAIRRIMQATATPAMWRGGRVVPAFWWDGHPNFGDDLTPWLLPRYGVLPVLRRPSEARLAGVGSILEFLPKSYDGAIWGSGLMTGEPHPLPEARVLAVRGPLSADLIGARNPTAFGDPGLLVGQHVRRPQQRWQLGFVPHGHHRNDAALARLVASAGQAASVVNVHTSAGAAVRHIAACGAVFTTSLHGLITADSYGIPACWTTMQPPLAGGDFKFRDYEAAVTPGRTRYVPFDERLTVSEILRAARAADSDVVESLSTGLVRALGELRKSDSTVENR